MQWCSPRPVNTIYSIKLGKVPFKCIYLIGNQAKEEVIGQTKVHLFNIRYLKTCVQRYKKYIID